MNQSAIGLAVATLVLGGAGGYLIGNNTAEEEVITKTETVKVDADLVKNGTTTSPAADLRVGLNNALREHVNIAGVALRNLYTNSPDTDAAVAALDLNSVEVAGLVGSVYGEDAEAAFLDLWRQHIVFFANYTVAARDGDTAGTEQALEDLAGYGEAAGTFFENANPNLPKSAVKPLLVEHRNAVIKTINSIGAGEFDQAYVDLAAAADQVSDIADALAGGIEAQFPDKF